MNDAASKLYNLLLMAAPSHSKVLIESILEMKHDNLSDDLICLQLSHMLVNVYFAIVNDSPVDITGYGWRIIDEGDNNDE